MICDLQHSKNRNVLVEFNLRICVFSFCESCLVCLFVYSVWTRGLFLLVCLFVEKRFATLIDHCVFGPIGCHCSICW